MPASGVIDLAAQIPKTTEYFDDDCHFTDEANRLIAEVVGHELDRRSGRRGRLALEALGRAPESVVRRHPRHDDPRPGIKTACR